MHTLRSLNLRIPPNQVLPRCQVLAITHTTLSHPPISISPSNLRIKKYLNSPTNPFTLNQSLRVINNLTTSPINVTSFSCCRHEDQVSEELEKPQLDQLNAERKYWFSSLQNVTDAVFSAEPWTMPWTAKTIVQVVFLWIASFWLVGSWIIPFLAHTVGFRKESLTYRGQAVYSLLTDVAEGLAGIAILHRCLERFRPLPSNWFRFSLGGKWQFDVGLGCFVFPLVDQLSQVKPVTVSNVEQSIVARDPVAMALYAVVVSVCAPVWEEIVFRGFLLPSLTKYMPVWCSILVSSLAFALAHFNMQRMLPLVLLGVVMGAVFAQSRNLLASMFLHSLWNAFVFLDLVK